MKTHLYYFFIVSLSLLSSCSNFLFEDDDLVNQTLDVPNIHKIQVENIFNIELIQDTVEYIIATGTKNQLKKLDVSSKDNTYSLKQSYNNLLKNYSPIKLEIHFKNINDILINSPVNISNTETLNLNNLNILVLEEAELVEMDLNLDCKKLIFHVKGTVSGLYKFKGECPSASYTLNGTTNLMALDFKSQNINIAQNSIGEAHLFAEKTLNATIYNFGDIYYKGQPVITEKRIQINNQSPTAEIISIDRLN